MDEVKCKVCGGVLVGAIHCPFCAAYHSPEKCEGEDCFICQQIIMKKEGLLPKGDEYIINTKHII